VPTYQYRCTQCGNELEVVQKFTDAALSECDECHGALRKVYNAVGVVFKGSGFYRTDSRAGNKSDGAGAKSEKSDRSEKSEAAEKSASTAPAASSSGESSAGSGGASTSVGSSDKKKSTASSTAA
jgi:putative FmdB family regulatory protein